MSLLLLSVRMSGRDSYLIGFTSPRLSAERFEKRSLRKLSNQTPKDDLNSLLDIAACFKIELSELCNALDLWSFVSDHESHCISSAATFLAALRLSVFWRRRRDILSQGFEVVSRILSSQNLSITSVMEGESELLSRLACNVWDGLGNSTEAIWNVLRIVGVRDSYSGKILSGSFDICLILSCHCLSSCTDKQISKYVI